MENVTAVDYNGVNAIVTASLLLNVHTMQSNALHISKPTFIYICSVNVFCADATAMLFHSAIPLTVWRVPCCSEFNTFDVKLSVITVCPPFNFELSMPRNLLKTFCAIDRLRLWKHCYHSVSFPVVV